MRLYPLALLFVAASAQAYTLDKVRTTGFVHLDTGDAIPVKAQPILGLYNGTTLVPLKLQADGSLLLSGSISVGMVDQGAPGSTANAWYMKTTDGTDVLEITGAGEAMIRGTVSVSNFPASQDVQVLNFPAIQTVDGTVNVGNFPTSQNVVVTNFPAVQPVSGSVSVANFPVTQSVSGTVAVSNFPATQPVSGTVAVSNFPATQPVSGSLGRTWTLSSGSDSVSSVQSGAWSVSVSSSALPTGAATSALQTTGNASLSSIDADVDVVLSTRASETTLASVNAKLTGASTATSTNVSVTTGSTVLLAANANRKMATFYNDGGGNVYIKLGTAASTTSFMIRLTDNSFYELPLPIYTGTIEAVAAAGTRTIRVTEY